MIKSVKFHIKERKLTVWVKDHPSQALSAAHYLGNVILGGIGPWHVTQIEFHPSITQFDSDAEMCVVMELKK